MAGRSAMFESTGSVSETDLLLPPNPSSVPRDRLFVVYSIFYLLGVGTLLPWNFFSNAKDYFMYKLRNTTSASDYDDPDNETELQSMFESYLSVAAMVPGVLFMFLNTVATKLVSLRLRIVSAAIVVIIMFAVTVVLVKVDTDSWQINFFAVTLVTIVIMNAGSAVLQGGIFGLAGMFPPRYTQAVMGGMGMGGTLASAANIMAIAVSKTPLDQGFGYFLTALLVIVLALIGYLLLPHLTFARFHTTRTIKVAEGTSDPTVNENQTQSQLEDGSATVVRRPVQHLSLWSIFTKMWMYALSVFIIFMVTLSCYPAVASAIKSQDTSESDWATKYFNPVMCFLVFNFFDLVGRTLAGVIQLVPEGSMWLPILAVLRVVFVPLFLLCNVQKRAHIPVLLVSDAWPIAIMTLFALTNGYLGTLAMMYGPRRVPLEDVETGGAMMSFFLSSGLGVGSLLSFLLLTVV